MDIARFDTDGAAQRELGWTLDAHGAPNVDASALLAEQLRRCATASGACDLDALKVMVVAEYAAAGAALREQSARFAAVLDNMTQGLCVFDGNSRLVVSNRQYADVYKIDPALIQPGLPLEAVIRARYEAGTSPLMELHDYKAWRQGVRAQGRSHNSVFELKDHRVIAIRHQTMPDGGWLATHEDVTGQHMIERRLAHLAEHDATTGLPNRVAVSSHLQNLLTSASAASPCAVLMIGLDGLRRINSTLSGEDRAVLLRLVAGRLRQRFRPADLVGHTGGEEFAIVIAEEVTAIGAPRLVGQVHDAMAAAMELGGRSIVLSASVGIATAVNPGLGAENMLAQASIALDRAQTEGRGSSRLFEPAMDALLQERHALESDLRDAVDRLSFTLSYQPQIELPSRVTAGFEALLRWTHAVRGPVPPSDFIPVAEELGLIGRIGDWVLDRACADCATWPDEISVAVNVSALQFRDGRLPATVRDALARHRLRPERLELEVTESCIISDPAHVAATLQELRAIGVRIAMDDFGTGYSSLSRLPTLPFDKVKIDRAFIVNLENDPSHLAIVRAIVGLCRGLHVDCIAEGVETEGQLAVLQREDCREVQGYLLGRPCSADRVLDLLASPPPPLPPAAPPPRPVKAARAAAGMRRINA